MEQIKIEEQVINSYLNVKNKNILFCIVIGILLLVAVFISLITGAAEISFFDIVNLIKGEGNNFVTNIIWNIRLPRVLTAVFGGMGLALSGVVMQSILKNPLGSPFTLGVSQAASFGAAFAIIVLPVVSKYFYLTIVSAFSWSLISTLIILLLIKYREVTPETMILTGVALSSLFSAGTTALQYFADDIELSTIVFWSFGDVGRTTWSNLLTIIICTVIVLAYFSYRSWDFNALQAGDETAISLGVNVEQLRLWTMIIASFLTALIVSMVGIIGFIGLVTPHIVRKIIGGDEKFLIPATALTGGLLLLLADLTARTIIAPVVLPVGILTSFLGAPLFIYLVIKGRKYW